MSLVEKDLKYIWHPFNHKGTEITPIVKAEGAYLFGEDGKKYINCFDVTQFTENEDNKELHSSTNGNHKNIGEYYRTLEHQSMVYQIHFKMD